MAVMSGRRSLLGAVAGVYITLFVGSLCGASAGLLVGIAAAGLEGAYAGVISGAAVMSAAFLFGGNLSARVLGGLLAGAGAAATGLTFGAEAGVWGGAAAGVVAGLLGCSRLDFPGPVNDSRALRAAVWAMLGAVAGGRVYFCSIVFGGCSVAASGSLCPGDHERAAIEWRPRP